MDHPCARMADGGLHHAAAEGGGAMTDNGRRATDDGPQATGERDMDRRDVVKLLATASLAAVGLGAPEVAHAWELTNAALASQGTGTQFTPAFFTPVEWRAVRSLVDVVIPRDDRSGSATDAGVPEFMDFMMVENPKSQPWMRDGLKWLNDGCRKRFGRCLLYTSDAADDLLCVDLGGRRIIKKK